MKKIVEVKISKKTKDELLRLIKKQEWRRAKTGEEYFVFFKSRRLYNRLYKNIRQYGVNEIFKSKDSERKNRYLYLGKHSYWVVWPILNRIENRYIVHKNGKRIQIKGAEKQ